MAIGTHWAQIFNGINLVFFSYSRERAEVVHMDEFSSNLSVDLFQSKFAN
jgi:hypothetical protein